MFLATTYNSLRLLRASRSRNLSLLFAYRATSSPFYAHNKAPPKLPGHLCASTGVCSLLLLITHSDCYALRVPAICPYYSHIARLRRPFMLIIYNSLRLLHASRSRNLSLLFAYRATSSPFYAHNKAPPKLPGHLCASTGVCSLLLLITHLRLLHASRSRNLSLLFAYRATSSPFYAHNKAPPKLPGHLCASTGVLEVPGVGELHEFCFF